jgi:quercetin dioxygenase-like cupin family protein
MGFLDWNDVPGNAVGPDVVVWEATGDGVQVVRTRLAAGALFATHRHDQEQLSIVLEGRLEVSLGAEVRTVGPGEVVLIPRGTDHSTKVVSETPAVTLEVFAPPRTDLRHTPGFAH